MQFQCSLYKVHAHNESPVTTTTSLLYVKDQFITTIDGVYDWRLSKISFGFLYLSLDMAISQICHSLHLQAGLELVDHLGSYTLELMNLQRM